VREEAVAISRAGNRSFMAPIHSLHFYYKLTHMVDESSDPIFGDTSKSADTEGGQIELPLRAMFETPTVAGLSNHIEASRCARDEYRREIREAVDQTEETIV